MKTFNFIQMTISHNLKDPNPNALKPDCLSPFLAIATQPLWAGNFTLFTGCTLPDEQCDSPFFIRIQIRESTPIFTSSTAENMESQFLDLRLRFVNVIYHKTQVKHSFSLLC